LAKEAFGPTLTLRNDELMANALSLARGRMATVRFQRDKSLEAARTYIEKRRFDMAIAELRKVATAEPHDARVQLRIADLEQKLGRIDDALKTYEAAAQAYVRQGFTLKAVAVYKRMREISSGSAALADQNAQVISRLADLFQQLGLRSDALSALDEAATALNSKGRHRDAIALFRKMTALDPANPLAHTRLAEACAQHGSPADAVRAFNDAAALFVKLARRDEAIRVLERSLHHKPDAENARTCAVLYLDRGLANDAVKALSILHVCLQSAPQDLKTLELVERAFLQLGQADNALEVRKEMARAARDADDAALFRELVEDLLRRAPSDRGVRRLARSADLLSAPSPVPTPPAPETADPTDVPQTVRAALDDAATLREAGLFRNAIEVLRRTIANCPDAIELRVLCAEILVETGDHDDAADELTNVAFLHIDRLDAEASIRALTEALSLKPSHPRARALLSDLGYEISEAPAEGPEALAGQGDAPPQLAEVSQHEAPDPEPSSWGMLEEVANEAPIPVSSDPTQESSLKLASVPPNPSELPAGRLRRLYRAGSRRRRGN